ncbi:MAG: exodeoxyribonuclease VII small subunit [Prevotella sp.]|nr:exodeoxyribonuclease VII small subunit [Prevotella sp.]MBQ4633080.1 exodeoxyribonuclease VII small subunit [Prevotella sp.]MBQ5606578.1 exodeoxyribonuclease VII small subunit [Prevotella sp.]MBQ8629099.1 exodeoxyribonuclease VII small subunit [Prevotella sp.]
MDKNLKFEQAIKQLEEITSRMEENSIDIDRLLEDVKTANQLIKMCRKRLADADAEINEILEDINKDK